MLQTQPECLPLGGVGHEQVEAEGAGLAGGGEVERAEAAAVGARLQAVPLEQGPEEVVVAIEGGEVEGVEVGEGGGGRLGAQLQQQLQRRLGLAARARHQQR